MRLDPLTFCRLGSAKPLKLEVIARSQAALIDGLAAKKLKFKVTPDECSFIIPRRIRYRGRLLDDYARRLIREEHMSQQTNTDQRPKAIDVTPEKKGVISQLAQEGKDTFSAGLSVFRHAKDISLAAASAIVKGMVAGAAATYENVIKPYGAPAAGVLAVGAAGTAAVMAFGIPSLVIAGSYGAEALIYGAAGAILTKKVLGWTKEGYNAVASTFKERVKDVKNFIQGAREGLRAYSATTAVRALEKCDSKVGTDVGRATLSCLDTLGTIKSRYAQDPDVAPVVDKVIQTARSIFDQAPEKYHEAFTAAQAAGVPLAEAKRQTAINLATIKDKLTTDVFAAYNAALEQNGNPDEAVTQVLDATSKLLSEFTITKPESGRRKIDYSSTEA